jgi:hypothetical protein
VKFTPAEREYFAKVRKESPEVDSMFTAVRQMMETFRGAKIVHLKVRDSEWGRPMPEGVPYVPMPRVETIPKGKKKQQAQQTVGQRRRAATRYKGDPT